MTFGCTWLTLPIEIAYRRVNIRHHASRDDEAAVSVFSVWLLSEIMHSQLPGIEGAVNVHPDNVQIRLGRLAVGV